MKKKAKSKDHLIVASVGAIIAAIAAWEQGFILMLIFAGIGAGMANVGFRALDYFMREFVGISGWVRVLACSIGIAFAVKLLNLRIIAPGGPLHTEFAGTVVFLACIAGLVAVVRSARVRETIKTVAIEVVFMPTPLYGAARLFGYFLLGFFFMFAEQEMFASKHVGRTSAQVTHMVLYALALAIAYYTAYMTVKKAWQSAGRLADLRSRFKEATKGFPDDLSYHNGAFSGFAVNPASRSVVLSARRFVDGTSTGQPNELLTLSYDDISEIGTFVPGFGFAGVTAWAGYEAFATTAVIAVNDLTRQRIAGAFDTGMLFVLKNKEVFLVQAPESDLPEFVEELKRVVR